MVRVWDLTTRTRIGEPLAGHDAAVVRVEVAAVGGRPVVAAATTGWDGTVRVFDLDTGRQLCRPLDIRAARWMGAVTAVVDGRQVVVSGDSAGARVWDRATREQIGRALTDSVPGVAGAVLDGRPVVISAAECGRDSWWHGNAVRVWELATHEEVGARLPGHTHIMEAVATTVLEGRPVVLTASWDAVRVWDLTTRTQIGEPLTDKVSAMVTGVLDGRPVAVTGGETDRDSGQGVVRVWDLTTRGRIGPELAFPLPVESLALAPGDRLVVGFGREIAVLSHR